jgi:penicillin-binding protein-related factor A (putative recombinase)
MKFNVDTSIGKKAEAKIKEWLDKPEEGYCFDRIPDQMTGFYGSKNICDFTLFKSPNMYYIESKATWEDRFDFSMLSSTQHDGLLEKSKIPNVYGVVIVLFAHHQRAFIIDINEIKRLEDLGKKSININKIDNWGITYTEIQTIPNSRKTFLDYTGEFIVKSSL